MPYGPAFCPYRRCRFNRSPVAGFARRHGDYCARSRPRPVTRFRCAGCRRTFSVATFRYSYGQMKPEVDAALVRLLCNGVSQRGAARLLGVNRKTVASKLRRLGRHSRRLQLAVLRRRRIAGQFQIDELETFESNRYQPVTVPVVIEKRSYFILSTATAPLRRKGAMTARQKVQRARFEALHGRRPTSSDAAVRRCLSALRRNVAGTVRLQSDRKPSYGRLARLLLGRRLRHTAHDSRRRRDRSNPLFAINHTNAMLRYHLARLRRRTWCVSRRRQWLQLALQMFAGWFNFCRGITNKTAVSPAQTLGLARRRLDEVEWLGYRQDWHNAGRLLPSALRRPGEAPRPFTPLRAIFQK